MMGSVPDVVTAFGEYRDFGGILTPDHGPAAGDGRRIAAHARARRVRHCSGRGTAPAAGHPGACGQVAGSRTRPGPRRITTAVESKLRNAREALVGLVPPAYDQQLGHARLVERASDRKIRERNKISYRLNHWPIWIWTFFIAPGPLTFDLFAHGFDRRMAAWLGVVLAGTGIAGLLGKLPGVEPAPYIIRFTEDRPNPLYRRICYTFAWSAVITFAVLNIAGLAVGDRHGRVAAAPDLRRRLLPPGRHDLGAGAARPPAARQGVDEERRPRAPVLLRLGVGGVRRAAGALAVVDRAAARWRAGTCSSSPSSSASWSTSAISRAAACCRARARSCRASWRCRIEADG